MLGPIIDSGCLLAGGLAGAYSAHLVPRRIKESLPPIFGVVTLCMGMTLVNKVASMPVVVASLLLGTLLGELVFAESRRIVRQQGWLDRLMDFSTGNPATARTLADMRDHMHAWLAANA